MLQKPFATGHHRLSPAFPFGLTSLTKTVHRRPINHLRIKACLTISCLVAALAPHPVLAELPTLPDRPWLGYYAVYANKNYEFKVVAANGLVSLLPLGEGGPVMENLIVYIKFGFEEILPDGKIVSRPIRADTLETADPASEKIGKCVIRGKTAGDASIEIVIEQSRGMVFVGSQVLDPATLTNPLRCSVSVVFPNVNPPVTAANNLEEVDERDAKRANKKQAKVAKDKLKDDSVDLKWIDGKTQKITFEKPIDAGSAEVNGPGITAAEIKIAAYRGKKFVFNASANSAMKLSNIKPASLSEGFSIQWSPDLDMNKDGKARLAFEVK